MDGVNRYLPGSLSPLPSSRHRLKQNGYSLYELIITSAVASVLGAGAMGMGSLLQDARMTASVNQLMGDLSLARNEAIKRRTAVTLCNSENGTDCTHGSEWHRGWIVFADDNMNRKVDNGEAIIQIVQPLGTVALNFAGALNHDNYITYKLGGQAEPNGTFTFCDGRSTAKARSIIVLGTGRPRVSTKTSEGKPLRC
jgi:type IV fimbrial biogenesis protein FimT